MSNNICEQDKINRRLKRTGMMFITVNFITILLLLALAFMITVKIIADSAVLRLYLVISCVIILVSQLSLYLQIFTLKEFDSWFLYLSIAGIILSIEYSLKLAGYLPVMLTDTTFGDDIFTLMAFTQIVYSLTLLMSLNSLSLKVDRLDIVFLTVPIAVVEIMYDYIYRYMYLNVYYRVLYTNLGTHLAEIIPHATIKAILGVLYVLVGIIIINLCSDKRA